MFGQLAGVVLIVGVVMLVMGKTNGSTDPVKRRLKFWFGLILTIDSLAVPGFFVYEMLYVPGGGDAIFLVMVFGPLCVLPLVAGIRLMVRNRGRVME